MHMRAALEELLHFTRVRMDEGNLLAAGKEWICQQTQQYE